MKTQAALALLCAALLAAAGARADSASDQDMASRYMQAAQSGNDDAQFYVGALYSAGVGLPASDQDAGRWFSRAADQGHSHAMLILAGLYAIGRGVPKDNEKSYKLAYIVASASKVDEFRNGARQLLGVLETKMTPDQINLAKADANAWHATPNAGPLRANPPVAAPSNPAPQTSASVPPAAQAVPAQSSGTTTILPSPLPRTGNDQPDLRLSKGSKSDVDNLLDQVPQGLRKRFGF
jgi:hypothetical protein